MNLAQAISGAMPPDNGLRIAKVKSTSPLTVSVQGVEIQSGLLANYYPRVGDVVAVFREGDTWLVLGRVIPPGQAGPKRATSGLTVASGFSLLEFIATKTETTCSIWINVAVEVDIAASGGNIPDTHMCTLPVDFRPKTYTAAIWGNGVVDGECRLNPDGRIFLRTANGALKSGTGLRLHSTFLTV